MMRSRSGQTGPDIITPLRRSEMALRKADDVRSTNLSGVVLATGRRPRSEARSVLRGIAPAGFPTSVRDRSRYRNGYVRSVRRGRGAVPRRSFRSRTPQVEDWPMQICSEHAAQLRTGVHVIAGYGPSVALRACHDDRFSAMATACPTVTILAAEHNMSLEYNAFGVAGSPPCIAARMGPPRNPDVHEPALPLLDHAVLLNFPPFHQLRRTQ